MAYKPGEAGNTEHQYQPGESGNPDGAPKGKRKSTLLRELLEIDAPKIGDFQSLADKMGVPVTTMAHALHLNQLRIAMEGKDADATKAYQVLMDREHGKPAQSVKLTDGDGKALMPTVVILPDNGRDRDRKEKEYDKRMRKLLLLERTKGPDKPESDR